MQTKPVEQLKRGEYVRRIINNREGEQVYRRGEYDATYKRYALENVDDVNRTLNVKRGTELSYGFTY